MQNVKYNFEFYAALTREEARQFIWKLFGGQSLWPFCNFSYELTEYPHLRYDYIKAALVKYPEMFPMFAASGYLYGIHE